MRWVASKVPTQSLALLNPKSPSPVPKGGEMFQRVYASHCLKSLGLNPDAIIQCQGMFSLPPLAALIMDGADLEGGHATLSLAAAACEMADVDHTRCLNASIPLHGASSGTLLHE